MFLSPDRTEVHHREIKPTLHLPVGLFGQTDRAGLGDAFQTRSDVDAVAHQVAVALLDHVAQMNADPEDDAAVLGHAGVALHHGVLKFDGAAHGVDHASELDDRAVAGALDDAAVVNSDSRIDEVAAQRPEARKYTVLVGAGKAAEAGGEPPKSQRVSGFRSSRAPSTQFSTDQVRNTVVPLRSVVADKSRSAPSPTVAFASNRPVRNSVGGMSAICVPVRRRRFPVGASPTRQPLPPEATGAVMEVTKWLKPSV